jgi:hypothetical protein
MGALYELREVTPCFSPDGGETGARITTRRIDWGTKPNMLEQLRADPVRLLIHRLQQPEQPEAA